MQKFDISRPLQVGGQAVIEGVMMRGPGRVATAVRQSDGEIAVKTEEYVSVMERVRVLKLPILRGAVGMMEMMVIGIRTLNFSAEVALEDPGKPELDTHGSPQKLSSRRSSLALGLTVAVSLAIGVAAFFVTPLFLTTRLFEIEQDPLVFNLMAGGIRILLFLVYLGAISSLRDIRRLFEYHGAEHKAVFAFEKGRDLTIASAAVQPRFHPRCGTSFLLIVMLSSILLFSVLDTLVISWIGNLNFMTRLTTHLPLIPVVGGVSYEFIRFTAKHRNSLVGNILVAPGLWLQHITTREPDKGQLEVALAALRSALGQEIVKETPEGGAVRMSEGYA